MTMVSMGVLSLVCVYWYLKTVDYAPGFAQDAHALSFEEPLMGAGSEALAHALGGKGMQESSAPAPDANALMSARLRLMGIVYEPDRHLHVSKSLALIGLDQQVAKPYKEGMQLSIGWTVESIAPNEVRLSSEPHGPVGLVLSLPKTNGLP
jgi:hypothetical protein